MTAEMEMETVVQRLQALPEEAQAVIAPRLNAYLNKLDDLRGAHQEGVESGHAGALGLDTIIRETHAEINAEQRKDAGEGLTHWNYRIYRYDNGVLGVHEAYYEGEQIVGYTDHPIIVGDDIDELKAVLSMIARDIERCQDEILDYEHDNGEQAKPA